jgi:predicted acyl esterase
VGLRDQREVEAREDALCYTPSPLRSSGSVEVTDPVELAVRLLLSGQRPTSKLVDVHPHGRAENLPGGTLRTRYRESL